jgi:hypothetical protein
MPMAETLEAFLAAVSAARSSPDPFHAHAGEAGGIGHLSNRGWRDVKAAEAGLSASAFATVPHGSAAPGTRLVQIE